MMPFRSEISLSSLSLILFSSLLSFFVSPFALSSLQTQTPSFSQHQHQHHTPSSIVEASPSLSPISIAEASHGLSFIFHRIVAQPIHPHLSPSLKLHTASLTSLLFKACTGVGFWILDFGGWISVDRRAGFGSMGGDRLIGGFGSVDWWVWNNGSVDRWVDRLGWSSVVPMVVPVMIFFWMGLLRWCCFSGVDRWVDHLLRWWFFFYGLWWIWSVGGLFASIFFDDFLWWFDGLTVGFAPMILFIYLWFDGLCVEPVLEVDREREEKKKWLLESLGKCDESCQVWKKVTDEKK